MIHDLIIITGTQRSGISIIAGLINLCGAWGGRFDKQPRFNGKVSYENADIRQALVRPLLYGMRADPWGQRPLPDIKRCRKVARKVAPTWKRTTERTVLLQGYTEGPIFIASAQAAPIWPVWAKAFPGARWVLVRRDDGDIVQSCLKSGFMRGYSSQAGWQQWVEEHKMRFEEMAKAGLNMLEIWPQKIIQGKFEELKNVVHRLMLRWDQSEVEDFVAPILWKAGVFEMSESDNKGA